MQVGYDWPWEMTSLLAWFLHSWRFPNSETRYATIRHGMRLLGLYVEWDTERQPGALL